MATPRRVALTLEQCWHEVPGGTATSALASIEALRAHTDLDLIGVAARHRLPPADGFRPAIPVGELSLPRLVLYEAWHRLRRPRVERATGPVDVIHVTGMAMPPRSAPLVVTVHDLAFVDEPAHFTARGVRFFHRAIDLAVADADVVVCPSQATIDDCVRYGFTPDRLRLVPWGISTPVASEDAVAAARARYDLKAPYVFWTGTVEPRKNLGALLDAFARIERDDVELVLGGPAGWHGELDALEQRLGGRVRRIGFVPVADLPAVYAGAEVFCFPSLREGFGLPVLEAMAQGVPVVTSSGTATAEVVGDAGAGVLVEPRDPVAIAGALDAILGDPVAARTMGAAAATRAQKYVAARAAADLVRAYDDAVGA